MSLRVKLAGLALVVSTLLSVVFGWQFRMAMLRALTEELERNAIATAQDVARRCADSGEVVGLMRQVSQNLVTTDTDVRYIILYDQHGSVLSRSPATPSELSDPPTLALGQGRLVQRLQAQEEPLLDVSVPVPQGIVATVRVIVSLRRPVRTVAEMGRPIALTALALSLLGTGVSAGLTLLLTRPLVNLIAAIRRVGAGDLAQRVVPWAADEIGQAQASFNDMVERLKASRDEMEQANERLAARNRELGALYAVARAIAGPIPLHEILERGLHEVIDLTGCPGGWICLLGEERACEVCVSTGRPAHTGLGTAVCQECRFCQQVAQSHEPFIVTDLPPGCPIASEDRVTGHAIIPFLVKDQVVGLLNLVCSDRATVGADDLGLLMDLGRQLGVAIENARLWEELRRKEELRGKLLRQVITAQETERQRISRELHDEAGQALTSVLVGLRAVDRADNVDRMRELIAGLRVVVNQTLDEIHGLALELRPSVLDDLGLVRALERQVQNAPTRFGFEADFVATGITDQRLPPEVETTLYRIAQEALTNVARHANAHHVSVLLQRRRTAVALVIEDDGQGFDVARAMESTQGSGRLGLYGIEERAALIGGSLTVESADGAGTTVSVEIPLEEAWQTHQRRTRETRGSPSAC